MASSRMLPEMFVLTPGILRHGRHFTLNIKLFCLKKAKTIEYRLLQILLVLSDYIQDIFLFKHNKEDPRLSPKSITLLIRTDKPEQSVKTLIRCHKSSIFTTTGSQVNTLRKHAYSNILKISSPKKTKNFR